MPFSINTNVNAMAAVRSLNAISAQMEKTQARVETGLKIGGAKDDPAVFAISQAMRADIKGLEAVKDSLGFGKATLAVANNAIRKISDELAAMKQSVLQGQQQGIDRATMNEQIANALANIQTYADSATFNGVNLLADANVPPGGAVDFNLDIIKDLTGATLSVANQNATVQGIGLTGLTVDQGAMTITFDNAIAFANGDHVELVRADGTSVAFEFVDSATPLSQVPGPARQVLDVQYDSAIQSVLDGLNALVQRIRSAGFGATVDGGVLTVSGGLDVVASAIANGSTVNGDADADPATYEIAGLTSDAAATAAGVKAYQVVAGAGTPTIAAGAAFGIANGARAAIAAIDGAIETVGARMATLGSASRQVEGLQDFAASLYDSVKEGLGALVDADLAAESAQLTALQAKQQLAVQSLSIANQTPQSLLTLFK